MLTSTMRTARVLAVLGLVALTVAGCRGTTRTKTPVHLNWNMDNQASLQAQTPTSFYDNGAGMRLPVANTIAQGELPADAAFADGHVNGRYLTELPEGLTLDEALLDRGQERYGIYCAPCHGTVGDGVAPVPARADAVGAVWIVPSFHDELREGYPVGRIYDVATNGYSTMRGYRAQVPAEDRWAIAAWVKALQLTQTVTASVDAEEEGN